MLPKKPCLRMCAAGGSKIRDHGRKVIKLSGSDFNEEAAEPPGFTRRHEQRGPLRKT